MAVNLTDVLRQARDECLRLSARRLKLHEAVVSLTRALQVLTEQYEEIETEIVVADEAMREAERAWVYEYTTSDAPPTPDPVPQKEKDDETEEKKI